MRDQTLIQRTHSLSPPAKTEKTTREGHVAACPQIHILVFFEEPGKYGPRHLVFCEFFLNFPEERSEVFRIFIVASYSARAGGREKGISGNVVPFLLLISRMFGITRSS